MAKHSNDSPGAQARATGAKSTRSKLDKEDSTKPERAKAFPRQHAWKERNQLKVWAHSSLRSGLRRGLIQPQPCAYCGKPKAEAHHDAYDRPLDVIWLCRGCHKRLHAERRAKP
jgi:hypothetical protein